MLFNEFADIIDTNSEFYIKLSNYAKEIWGPGVSEDTQMEMTYWLKGIKMWAVKQAVAIMVAEKEWSRYKVQNAERYNYSEVLFNIATLLTKIDILEARYLGKQPPLLSWAEMSEIIAGRTWYKLPFAKRIELGAIPKYLGTFGYVLYYPVDLTYFMGAWLANTIASGWNYLQHLYSLGYDFITGLFKNPSMELTFLEGYYRGAKQQFLHRNQFGTFVLTVTGGGGAVPAEYEETVNKYAIRTGLSLAITAPLLVLSGLNWVVLALGATGTVKGLSMLLKGTSKNEGAKGAKKALAVGKDILYRGTGLALGTASLFTAGYGLFTLLANPLNLAVFANVIFGIYSFSLLLGAKREIMTAKTESDVKKDYYAYLGKVSKAHIEENATLKPKADAVIDALKADGYMDKTTGEITDKFTGQEATFALPSSALSAAEITETFKVLSKIQSKRLQETLDPTNKLLLETIKKTIATNRFTLSIDEIKYQKSQLEQVLREINIMDKKGQIKQGILHHHRLAAHFILDTHSDLEMLLCSHLIERLRTNGNDIQAKTELKTLLKETRNFTVIETASHMYRRLNLSL